MVKVDLIRHRAMGQDEQVVSVEASLALHY